MNAVLMEYFRTAVFTFERGWRHATTDYCHAHRHSTFEVVLHAAGSGRSRDSHAATTTFEEGGIVVYLPDTGHDQTMTGPGEDVCIHIGSDLPVPAQLPGTLYVPPSHAGSFSADVQALAAVPPTLAPLQQLACSHRAAALLIELIQAAQVETALEESPAERYAVLAHDYIRENLRSLAHLAEVANAIGISGDHLRHCFRKRYGIGLKEWHRAVRVERARDLLANSNLPLKVIADLCGFANARYFSSCFRHETGLTPATYRRLNTRA